MEIVESTSIRNGKKIKAEVIEYNGLRYLRYPDSPRRSARLYYRAKSGYRALHKDVWIAHHGPIPDGLHVHHKDFNTLNNSIENLEVLTVKEHETLHRKHEYENPIYKPHICVVCGGTVYSRRSDVTTCSRSCQRISLKIECICEFCGGKFMKNTWKKTKCCSKSCGQKLRNGWKHD